MLKILFAIPQLTGGGAERVVSVWANELEQRGYDVSILIFAHSTDEYFTSPGVRVLAVADTLDEYKAMSYLVRYKVIRNILENIKPKYVISFLPAMQVWMMFASFGMGIKRIETIRVNPWRISVTQPIFKFLWKICYQTCNKLILQATDQGPFFTKRVLKKSVVIPNPISPLYVQNYKQNTSIMPTEFIAAGRIDPQKNYKMMIHAFAQVASQNPLLRLRIFGTGSEEYIAEIKQHIHKLKMENNIFLMGRTAHMEEEYQKSDVFLMTSDYEGLPNALAEAMASQLICIATDCKTGPRDLIEDGINGFVVPVGGAESLVVAMKHVLAMPYEERAQMAIAAREKILNYCSLKTTTDILCSLLK